MGQVETTNHISTINVGDICLAMPSEHVLKENCFSDHDNFTMTQQNYPKAPNVS